MSFDMFSTLHFDSYISLAYVFENEIITNGRQLLGVLFFWFPRMFWKDKPVGSGAYVAQTTDVMGENNEFSNISMNFLGEGYINFGILGVFIFIIVLALFSRKMDKLFWQKYNGDYHNLFAPFYLYSLGILTFVLRGDLMSGLAYSISAMVAVTLITIIAKNFLQAEKHENIIADKCDS